MRDHGKELREEDRFNLKLVEMNFLLLIPSLCINEDDSEK